MRDRFGFENSKGLNLGIDVENKNVYLNDNHSRLVDTSFRYNPVEHDIGLDRYIVAVFQRKKQRRKSRGREAANDGSPLMYALKGINGYSISEADENIIYNRAGLLCQNRFDNESFDVIVPLPSSKPVAKRLAHICADEVGSQVVEDCFSKATNREVVAQLNQLSIQEHRKGLLELKKKLETNPNGEFTMKDVDRKLRGFISPIVLNPGGRGVYSRVLLVDDLVSTGSSFKSACEVLKGKYPYAHITCLTLLGPIV